MSDSHQLANPSSPDADSEEGLSPGQARIARALQYAAHGVFALLLFASFITSPLYVMGMGGVLGVSGVWICAATLALIALQYVWLANNNFFGDNPQEPEKAARRSRLYLLWMFLIVVALGQHHIRSLDHWGLAVGHDQPQYYVYLHSWVFDRDLQFDNEYKAIPGTAEMMWENHRDIPNYNVAPVGSAIVWMPYYLTAVVIAHVLSAVGVAVPTDGMSAPYAMAAIFGSMASVFLGLLCIHAVLRRFFSERAAFWCVALIFAGSPLLWYIIDEPLMSHAASFFAASLVLLMWVRGWERRGLIHWILFGAAIGLAMCVRPNHAVLLILPIVDAVRQVIAKRPKDQTFAGLGICLAAALAVFGCQLATWYFRYGAEPPPGAAVDWLSPDFVQIFFSTQNGVIAWHPALALGLLGLPIVWGRSRYLACLLAVLILIYTYFNAALWDWWGGGSFGMRRFIGVLPFFAPGMAAAGIWFTNQLRRRPIIAIAPLVVLIMIYNVMLMVQSRRMWTSYNEPKSFQMVLMGAVAAFHETFGSPFSYPANLAFALKHGTPLSQYDVSTGVPLRPWITLEGVALKPVLGRGWYYKSRTVTTVQGAAVANARESVVFVHLRDNQPFLIDLTLEAPLNLEGKQLVAFHLNGHPLGQAELTKDEKTDVQLKVPPEVPRFGVNELQFSWSVVTEDRVDRLIDSFRYGGLTIPTEARIHQAGYLYKLAVRDPNQPEQ